MQLIDIVGILASVGFLLSPLPQLIKTIKEKNASGMSLSFLSILFFSFVLNIMYMLFSADKIEVWVAMIVIQQMFGCLCWGVILWYRIFRK